jgi:hypothetical protein
MLRSYADFIMRCQMTATQGDSTPPVMPGGAKSAAGESTALNSAAEALGAFDELSAKGSAAV